MNIYWMVIFCNSLHDIIWIVQKCLSLIRDTKNLVVPHSTKLDISAIPIRHWRLRWFLESSVYAEILRKLVSILVRKCSSGRNRIHELVNKHKHKEANAKFPFLPPFYMCLWWPYFRWPFKIQIIWSRKSFSRVLSSFSFSWFQVQSSSKNKIDCHTRHYL